MASINKTSPSSIAMALAGMTASVDIPKPRDTGAWAGKDAFDAVTTRPIPANNHRAGLPTPPNSISPSLPPHGFKNREASAPPTPPAQAADSDIDLQDAVEHAAAQDQPSRGLALVLGDGHSAALDAAGAITPNLLAVHHLPGILLAHGPLAIRHVMGYLTTTVPGFSGVPPAKARRLVVGALEGRGVEATGGINGDVIFEKVGWGRWDAHRRGQPSRHSRRHGSPTALRHSGIPSALRSPSPYPNHHSKSLRIPHRARQREGRTTASKSLALSHKSRDIVPFEPETDADKMSMDDSDLDASPSSSEAPDDAYPDDDVGDVTDEEDWASIGAAALRAGSFPGTHQDESKPRRKYDYNARVLRDSSNHTQNRRGHGGGPASSTLAKSAPGLDDVGMQELMEGVGEDEGEAVQALLRLGSV